MLLPRRHYLLRASLLAVVLFSCLAPALAQGAKKTAPTAPIADSDADADHVKQRSEWFLRGRTVPGKSAAELRRRAYEVKMQARRARTARAGNLPSNQRPLSSTGGWTPLGPVPLASDASGSGLQNYNQVSGRATAVAIDPADSTGNTVYIGGAQGGVWKSTNAATSVANSVTWTPVTDDQATLSIGSIAIQPGNSNPSQSVILVGTGEADNSADSYFGLGILLSADAGNTWTLISTANSGSISFSGLGATRMAFSTANTSAVVVAMAAAAEGIVDGALTSNTYRGLYTSTDSGQSWTYDALVPGGASATTSATSVVYNAAAGLFFAAVRYQGFFSSPDGLTWTRLANQPGQPGQLSTTACPTSYSTNCPIYRGEITVVPGRNEMYVWFVALNSSGDTVDEGIWQSLNGGVSWTQINDSGISNCGDFNGCGVDQGFYNLDLLAVPNCPNGAETCAGNPTDLYAGAINLYKCSITSSNPTCATTAFINLTHVYGCDPFGAPAHVHPDEHALAFTIPSTGANLMYFANDGGIYRALNGFTGLLTGSCTGTNQFDDLNQNLGSMTQFVSFSEHPTNANTLLGGTQDNGSPATATATTSTSWGNVLGGDGGYNAIDPNSGNWFASQPDTGSGTLGIQECSSGVNCNNSLFSVVVSSSSLGGDDGAFYFPYILDPQSTTSMLVGTCRVWSGPRLGGNFTALSLNFDTLGIGTCSGTEVNTVRSLAAGGPANSAGSEVVYATTDGPGPNNLSTPVGGNVWVTTNAAAVSETTSTFSNVTLNGPGGTNINPNQFPISDVAIDTSDATGNTAYVTVMGFTGGPGHVWQTTNAGASWTDFTGTGVNALPDSPTNAVLVDPVAHEVYVGTDVGVFGSSTLSPSWTEVGQIPNQQGGTTGFLPDVAITALALFSSGGQKLLRGSTYGRGVWQFNLLAMPDFSIAVSNTPLTVFPGANGTFNGTLTSINGYSDPVELSCTAGTSSPPVPCTPSPSTVTPTQNGAQFTLPVSENAVGTYNFNIQALGTDPNGTTHTAPVTLQVVNLILSTPSPSSITEPRGAVSPPVSFQVTAEGTFNEMVTLACSFTPNIPGASCTFSPSATIFPTSVLPVSMSVTVTVPATTTTGPYNVALQATASGQQAPVTQSFTMNVTTNPTFVFCPPSQPCPSFPNVNAGSTGTSGPITVSSQDGFSSTVSLSCEATLNIRCSISPTSITTFPSTATLIINSSGLTAGTYQVTVQGVSGSITNSLIVPFVLVDYAIAGPFTLTTIPGGSVSGNYLFTEVDGYTGQIDLSCNASPLPGAQCALNPVGPITLGVQSIQVSANITVPSNATAGVYTITINSQDKTGAPTHSFPISLAVQDFVLGAIAPSSQNVGAGGTVSYSFNVSPAAAFSNPISLACSGAPSGSTCTVTPSVVTPGSSAATVMVSVATTASTPQGNNTISVNATSGSLAHSATASLTVANTLQLAVKQAFPSGPADPGVQLTASLLLTPNYIGTVALTCSAPSLAGAQCAFILPGGGSPSQIAISGTPIAFTLVVNIPNSAAVGNYSVNVKVQDMSGTPSQSISLPFAVAQDYTISIAQTSQTITAGQSITYNLSAQPVGASYTNPITLNCSAPQLPGTCSIAPNPLTLSSGAASAVMTVSTQAASSQLRPRAPTPWLYALWCGWFAALAISAAKPGLRSFPHYHGRPALLVVMFTLLFWLSSCGGGSNGSNSITSTGAPVTYTITVTGSPASIAQPGGATVSLIVN